MRPPCRFGRAGTRPANVDSESLVGILDGDHRQKRAVDPFPLVDPKSLDCARLGQGLDVLDHALDMERKRLRVTLDRRGHVGRSRCAARKIRERHAEHAVPLVNGRDAGRFGHQCFPSPRGNGTPATLCRSHELFPPGRSHLRKEEGLMIRILVAIGMTLLVAAPALAAQSNCARVRQAVATYGYASARRYALAHYGIQAVRYGDRCLKGSGKGYHVQRHRAHRPYHYYHTYRYHYVHHYHDTRYYR